MKLMMVLAIMFCIHVLCKMLHQNNLSLLFRLTGTCVFGGDKDDLTCTKKKGLIPFIEKLSNADVKTVILSLNEE